MTDDAQNCLPCPLACFGLAKGNWMERSGSFHGETKDDGGDKRRLGLGDRRCATSGGDRGGGDGDGGGHGRDGDGGGGSGGSPSFLSYLTQQLNVSIKLPLHTTDTAPYYPIRLS